MKLKPLFGSSGTVTAGSASGINDGAAAMVVASETAARTHGLAPHARIRGMASAGVEPRVMGIGPVPATNGGAIALGHPLGMSGARIAMTLVCQLESTGGRRGLATLCVGVGMGLALAIERI